MLLTNEFMLLGRLQFKDITPDKYEQYFTFTDRESYLQWVDNWKHSYATLTKHIRWAKGTEEGDPLLTYYSHPQYVYPLSALAGRTVARLMLVLRAEGKRRSWEMKLKRLAAESAA